MTIRWRTWGLSIGWRYLRPDTERWSGPYGSSFWYVQGLGLCLWRDTLPAETVGERGVW